MTVRIHRADEVPNFVGCLADIDEIFFQSSARHTFCDQDERQAFREMFVDRYFLKHRDSFFVAFDDAGRTIGYLAGCLENPTTLAHFNDVSYFRCIADICQDYPAHLHINVSKPFRNLGLGTQLIDRFAEWTRLHSVEGIQIVTSSTSRSIPFYKRCGFIELRTFPWNSSFSVCMGRRL
jgi:GNAT superfamily N-acetyltransferase